METCVFTGENACFHGVRRCRPETHFEQLRLCFHAQDTHDAQEPHYVYAQTAYVSLPHLL